MALSKLDRVRQEVRGELAMDILKGYLGKERFNLFYSHLREQLENGIWLSEELKEITKDVKDAMELVE